MSTSGKPKKKSSGSFGIVLVTAVLLSFFGVPIWLGALIGLILFVLWQVRKQQKSLEKIPLPPAQVPAEQAERTEQVEPADRPKRESRRKRKHQANTEHEAGLEQDQGFAQPAQSTQSAVAATGSMSSLPPAALIPSSPSPATNPYGLGSHVGHVHPLARQLRTNRGLQQAIIAMTVLGPSRSQEPYRLDPQSRSELAPPTR